MATIVYSGDPANYGSLMYWLAAIAYTLQIYFDFSGYSDMAIGLGRMFGFHFLENFNYPYISLSVTEFWRRWHISPVHLVPRLCVHPARRQPRVPGASGCATFSSSGA